MNEESRTGQELARGMGTAGGSEDNAARRCWGYREVVALLAVGVLAQMLATVAGLALAGRLGVAGADAARELLQHDARLAVPLQLLAWVPVLAYVAAIVSLRYRLPLRQGLAWITPPRSVRTYLRSGALLALGSLLASILIGNPDQASPMRDMFSNPEYLWILAAFGILAAPLIEELVFRGFLFAAFENAHGPWTALLVTSAAFTLLHGGQYGWHWQQLLVLLVVGTALGAIRMKSGSVQASTIAHATYNGMLFLVVASFQEGLR